MFILINVAEMIRFVIEKIEKAMGMVGNAGNHHFFCFPLSFQKKVSNFRVVRTQN